MDTKRHFAPIGLLKRTIIMAALIGCAAILPAAVTPFNCYRKTDGTPLLIPAVREYKAGEGSVKFPAAVSVAVPKGEELIVEQIAAELKRFPEIKVTAKDGDAFFRFVVTDKSVPKDPEGYTLAVNDKGVTVSSRTTDGLFRGAQTVRNLLRNTPAAELKYCSITDWPEFPIRSYTFNLRAVPAEEIGQVFRTVEALASFKLNTAFVSLEETFPFTDNPFVKRKTTYPKETLQQLIEFCRRRHIRIIPTLQVLSHAQWMTSHPDWEKMSEAKTAKIWNSMPCPQNEQAREVVRRAIEEHIALFKPEFFYVVYDEIYLCPFRQCERCRKTDPKKILADYLAFVQGVLDKHGVKMVVCHDCFMNSPEWKYGDWYRTQLRKDAWVRYWNYDDSLLQDNVAHRFRDFNLIGNAICGKPFNVHNMAKLMKANGARGMNMTYWYYSHTGVLGRLATETPDSLGGFVNGADYIWNLRDTPYWQLGYDGTFEMLRILDPEHLTLPPRTGHAEPMALAGAVNAELSSSGEFPRFADDAAVKEFADALAAMPERFRLTTSPGGRYYAVRLAGRKKDGRQGVSFHFGRRKAERISFLLTASRPENGLAYHSARTYGRKRFNFAPAAYFVIKYADGSNEKVPLGYRKELTDWNRPFGGFDMRLAVRGVDADRKFATFGIYDFVNPHPEKAISDISFGAGNLDGISPALLAVSAWGVDRPFGKAEFTVDPAEVAKRSGVEPPKHNRGIRIVHSFDRGMGEVQIVCSPALEGALKHEIVDDPRSPAGGKVLKITIPAGNYRGIPHDLGFLRVNVIVPDTPPAKTRSLVFDGKIVAAPGNFSHGNIYLHSAKDQNGRRSFRVYPMRMTGRDWQRFFVSRWNNHETTRVLKKIDDAKTLTVSYFFRNISEPVEIRIGNIGDTAQNVSDAPVWWEGGEAEPI